MLVDVARFIVWLLAFSIVATIEHTTGLPVLTVTVLVLAIHDTSAIWSLLFVTVAAAVMASLYLQSLFIVWLIFIVCALIFRSPTIRSRKVFLPRLLLIVTAAIIVAGMREPSITFSFVIHSCISACISGYLLWRRVGSKTRGLDIAELRFISE